MKTSFSKIRNILLTAIIVLSVFSFAGAVVSADSSPITYSSTGSQIETVTVYVPTTRTATVTDYLTSTVTKTKTFTTTESKFNLFDFENDYWWVVTVIVAGVVIGLILIILIIKR